MENTKYRQINLSAPNLISICVDRMDEKEIAGRCYHYYSNEPVIFSNIVELLCMAEQLFDRISFPQAATKPRSLRPKKMPERFWQMRPEKVISWEELIEHKGELATFVLSVKFRQNTTWQGDFLWKEEGSIHGFASTLECIKEIVKRLQ